MNLALKLGMGVALLSSTALLSAPAFAAKSAPTHSRYTGFYYDAKDPSQLADLVEASLKIDPTGHRMLDPGKCKKDGSCATPLNYLDSFRAHNPYRELSLEGLAAFMRILVKDCTITGELQMDRIDRVTGKTDVNGMHRRLDASKGECAWVDPVTHMAVLAQHCANPIGVRIDLNCVYINVEVKDEREFGIIWARYDHPTDPCFAIRRTTILYEPDSPRAQWFPVTPGCIGAPCNMDADDRKLGRGHVAQGQISVRPGRYQFRISPNELLVLCLKFHLGPTRVGSSFANGVRWRQDYVPIGREMHARVFYESKEAKADGFTLGGPRGLAFYASNRGDELEMQRLAR